MFQRGLLVASLGASALACATTQDLGAPTKPNDDAGVEASAPSDPSSGLEFGNTEARLVHCPATAPAIGDDCSDVTVARECTYDTRDLNEVQSGICGRSCVCGREKLWTCVPSPCAPLDDTSCVPDHACAGEIRCWSHCTGGASESCLSCACHDGRLVCRSSGSPPR